MRLDSCGIEVMELVPMVGLSVVPLESATREETMSTQSQRLNGYHQKKHECPLAALACGVSYHGSLGYAERPTEH